MLPTWCFSWCLVITTWWDTRDHDTPSPHHVQQVTPADSQDRQRGSGTSQPRTTTCQISFHCRHHVLPPSVSLGSMEISRWWWSDLSGCALSGVRWYLALWCCMRDESLLVTEHTQDQGAGSVTFTYTTHHSQHHSIVQCSVERCAVSVQTTGTTALHAVQPELQERETRFGSLRSNDIGWTP